ncbi:hypothetical protein N7517_001344 [Penicillium concentricum]|uniref:Uncharacterized protein n=1 Tax=Penicillium concentricum TaxID=293559 RepID=A0A9W9SRM2_9EURO|nr:uncharacterized protein N7517_001344 [Penicillium concentricum]KAJ5383433.1 hypothetical protein N7517_001344 [Penicillium concentricum]
MDLDLDTGNTSAHGSSARGAKPPALTCLSVPSAFGTMVVFKGAIHYRSIHAITVHNPSTTPA